MPDTKLTWKNIRDHLRRYGVIYVALIVLAAVGSNLLWTMTTPRVPDERRVLCYLADAYTDPVPLNAVAGELLMEAQAFDPDLRAVEFESLMFADPKNDYTGIMLLMARLATGEGDLFLAGPDAMDALLQADACLPLDDYWNVGWLHQLEPYYADIVDEETGESVRVIAGLKLDSLDALYDLRAMYNEGACLVVAVNGTNIETSMKTAELLVKRLEGEGDAHD